MPAQPDRSSMPGPGGHLGRRQVLAALAATATAGAGGLLAACGSAPAARPAGPCKRYGGHLAAGLTGGSAADTLDPHKVVTDIDIARAQSLYDPLVALDPQARQVQYALAEQITPRNAALTQWVIRLRQGVTFHDGTPLTADDVLFSFRRIHDGGLPGKIFLGPIDLTSTKALDKLTVLVTLTAPAASFAEQLAAAWFDLFIAPAGFSPARPNGTGPFTYHSFTPGQRSVFTRNPDYWQHGLPYAATLTIIDFPDTVSLADALMTGVIHAAGTLDGPQMASLATISGVTAVASPAGSIVPITMRLDTPPFTDVRVRQALRLIVDRPQLIDSALDGYGTPPATCSPLLGFSPGSWKTGHSVPRMESGDRACRTR